MLDLHVALTVQSLCLLKYINLIIWSKRVQVLSSSAQFMHQCLRLTMYMVTIATDVGIKYIFHAYQSKNSCVTRINCCVILFTFNLNSVF